MRIQPEAKQLVYGVYQNEDKDMRAKTNTSQFTNPYWRYAAIE